MSDLFLAIIGLNIVVIPTMLSVWINTKDTSFLTRWLLIATVHRTITIFSMIVGFWWMNMTPKKIMQTHTENLFSFINGILIPAHLLYKEVQFSPPQVFWYKIDVISAVAAGLVLGMMMYTLAVLC